MTESETDWACGKTQRHMLALMRIRALGRDAQEPQRGQLPRPIHRGTSARACWTRSRHSQTHGSNNLVDHCWANQRTIGCEANRLATVPRRP